MLVQLDAAPGTSLPEMNRITALASQELRSIAGVRDVGAHVGRAVTSDQVVNVNSGELWVSIDPDADYDATLDSIREVVNGYPGLSGDVLTYSNERVGEALTAADEDVVVRVYGEELEILRGKARRCGRSFPRSTASLMRRSCTRAEEPTVEVEVDLDAAKSMASSRATSVGRPPH